jgi:hypothetical protein
VREVEYILLSERNGGGSGMGEQALRVGKN